MNKKPLVSICLLNYNQAKLLPNVISTILHQKYSNFELIISDDCSTDNSWDVLQKIKNQNQNIIIIRTPRNIGMALNTNYAVSNAKGKYIALLHHDDLALDYLIDEWVNVIEKDDKIAFVFNDFLTQNYSSLEDPQKKFFTHHTTEKRNFSEIMEGRLFLKKHLLKRWNCPVRGTTLFNREAFNNIGLMDNQYGLLADVDLWMRFAIDYKVGYVKKPLLIVQNRQEINYPKEYTTFTWGRINILYNIHATNVLKISNKYSYSWYILKIKINIDILKWIVYALLKNKIDIIKNYAITNVDQEFWIFKKIKKIIK